MNYLVGADELLRNEFNFRKEKNQQYSLRSFAKDLGISPALVSLVLNKKKELSPKVLSAIRSRLEIKSVDFDSLMIEQSKIKYLNHVKHFEEDRLKNLSVEEFGLISEWYYFVILEMFNLNEFKFDFTWIACRLNISVAKVENAIIKLESVGLIKRDENGLLMPVDEFFSIEDCNYSSQAMRDRQKKILNMSINSIDEYEKTQRDHSSITLAVDKKLLPEIKNKIKKFRRSLGNYIAKNSEEADEVYEIQISFFPLTRSENSFNTCLRNDLNC